MRYLLDVNVLIALIDRYHIHHDLAHAWLGMRGQDGWATCAITENGLVRIVSNKKYPQSPGSASTLVDMLSTLKYAPEHEFWSETISLSDDRIFHSNTYLRQSRLRTPTCSDWQCTMADVLRPLIAGFQRKQSSAERMHFTS